jgi:hypothetical protein
MRRRELRQQAERVYQYDANKSTKLIAVTIDATQKVEESCRPKLVT